MLYQLRAPTIRQEPSGSDMELGVEAGLLRKGVSISSRCVQSSGPLAPQRWQDSCTCCTSRAQSSSRRSCLVVIWS